MLQHRVGVLLTPNGALLKFMKLAFDKAQHQTGLAHRRLPQQHQFELADFVCHRGAVRPGCSSTAASHWQRQETVGMA